MDKNLGKQAASTASNHFVSPVPAPPRVPAVSGPREEGLMSRTYILSEKMVLTFSCAAASGLGSGGVFAELVVVLSGLQGRGTPDRTQVPPGKPPKTLTEDGLNHGKC